MLVEVGEQADAVEGFTEKKNSKQEAVESLRINLLTEAISPHRLKVFRKLPIFGPLKNDLKSKCWRCMALKAALIEDLPMAGHPDS